METITIDNTNYSFVTDFKHNQEIRTSFNTLTQQTFGFHFEDWFSNGYWKDNYIPYSLVRNNKVICNVSVSKIDLIMEGEPKVGIQIGTVMTDEAYRHKGLNRFLMNQVMNAWREKADFIYLFANDSVLDFYPKFDFERIHEYQFSKDIDNSNSSKSSIRKLNMDNATDKDLFLSLVNDSVPISKISMRNNSSLIMFYCTSFMKNNVLYLEKLNAAVIMEIQGQTLHLQDIFSATPINLDEVIQLIADKSFNKVVLGFTPMDDGDYQKSVLKTEDTLFVFKDKADFFKNKTWRFPVLSHA